MSYLLGQFFGLLTPICSIITPFLKKKWQLLVANVLINVLVILNLLLIGQFGSGSYLCFVAIIQSFIALSHTKKGESVGIVEGIIFTLLYVGFGIFGIVTAPDFIPAVNYKNMLELLPILGALAQMVSVFVRDEQATRKWLLWNTVFWMIYAAAVGSSVFINDFLAFVSISSALYKYRKKNNDKTPA